MYEAIKEINKHKYLMYFDTILKANIIICIRSIHEIKRI